MSKQHFTDLSDEQLIKRRNQFRGVVLGLSAIYIVMISLVGMVFFVKGFDKKALPAVIPLCIFPIIMIPAFQNISKLKQAMKDRGLS